MKGRVQSDARDEVVGVRVNGCAGDVLVPGIVGGEDALAVQARARAEVWLRIADGKARAVAGEAVKCEGDQHVTRRVRHLVVEPDDDGTHPLEARHLVNVLDG